MGRKTAIAISGLASEKIEWLNIQLKHTVTNQQKWFHANEYQQNADNTFETYTQSIESNDPTELGSYQKYPLKIYWQ